MYCYVIYHPASFQVAEFYLSVTRKYCFPTSFDKLRLSLAEELRKTPKGTESVLSKALVVISCNADRALCRTHTLGSYARKDLSLKDGLVDRVICSLGIAHITEQNRAGVYRFFKRVRSEDLGLAQLALSHADEPNRIFCIGSAFRSREVAIQNWMTVIDMAITDAFFLAKNSPTNLRSLRGCTGPAVQHEGAWAWAMEATRGAVRASRISTLVANPKWRLWRPGWLLLLLLLLLLVVGCCLLFVVCIYNVNYLFIICIYIYIYMYIFYSYFSLDIIVIFYHLLKFIYSYLCICLYVCLHVYIIYTTVLLYIYIYNWNIIEYIYIYGRLFLKLEDPQSLSLVSVLKCSNGMDDSGPPPF